LKIENYPYFTVSVDRQSIIKIGKIFSLILLFTTALFLVWIALTQFQAVSLPFLFSILLTFLLEPPVIYLERKGISRTKATFFVFLGVLLIVILSLILLFPALTNQIENIQQQLEGDYLNERIKVIVNAVQEKFPFLAEEEGQEGLATKVEHALASLQEQILNFAMGLFSALSNVVIIPFITFFLLKDRPAMTKRLIQKVSNRYFEMVLNLQYKTEQQLGGYIRGQMLDALIIGILSIIALYILNIDYYFFIGAIAGLANLIPYLGPVVGAVPAILVSLMQDPSINPILGIIIAFAVIQLIDNVVISPLVVAKSVDIHPLVVIVVIFIGERLLGVLGMLIAVPVTGILNVLIRETIWSFKNYRLL